MSKEFLLEQVHPENYDSVGCIVNLIKGSSKYNLKSSLLILNKCLLDSNFFNDVIVRQYFEKIEKAEAGFSEGINNAIL